MKCLIFLLILQSCHHMIKCCILHNSEDYINSFEYGVDVGRVAFNIVGKMTLLQKEVKVPITVNPCQKLVYVSVKTRNIVGPPYVSVDWDLNLAIIKYRWLQFSDSCYVIIAKAQPIPNCM